jgi:glycosyltransferase involved in cell wall biosynthesis
VVTIHDLGYLHEPEGHTRQQRRMLDLTTRWSARQAERIIAISEATRGDLIEQYGTPSERIAVIPHGVSPHFRPASDGEMHTVREKHGLPERFLLAVGTVQPRKNLVTLAAAVERLWAEGFDLPVVVVGKLGWRAQDVIAGLHGALARGAVRILGYVPRDDLPALYSAAAVIPFVSRYEGFGLPALEAMACGTPVVVSDRGALPEVTAGHATVLDADDAEAIAWAIRELLTDDGLRARRSEAGLRHAACFSWRRTAEATLALLREVRDGSRS